MAIAAGDVLTLGGGVLTQFSSAGDIVTTAATPESGGGIFIDSGHQVYILSASATHDYWKRLSLSLNALDPLVEVDNTTTALADGVLSRDRNYFYAGVQYFTEIPVRYEIRKYSCATGALLDDWDMPWRMTAGACISQDDTQVFWTRNTTGVSVADRLSQFTFAGASGGELAGFATAFGVPIQPVHHFANGDFLIRPNTTPLSTLRLVDSTGTLIRTFTVSDYAASATEWGESFDFGDDDSFFWAPAAQSANQLVGETVWLFKVRISDGALLDSFSRVIASAADRLRDAGVVGAVTCTPVLLLGTDTGHIYRRVGQSATPSLAFTDVDHTSFANSSPLFSLTPDSTDFRNAGAIYRLNSGSTLHSEDGGATWTQSAHVLSGQIRSVRDATTGDLYNADYNATPAGIYKSTNNGETWSAWYTPTPKTPRDCWVDNNWVYMTRHPDPFATDNLELWRRSTDGATLEQLTHTGTISSLTNINGQPGTNTAYVFSPNVGDVTDPIWRIDTSTGAVTTLGTPPIDSGDRINWIAPLTASVAILQTWRASGGALWRTTDAGVNWTEVKDDADLELDEFEQNPGSVAPFPENTARVVAAGLLPNYWESTDSGVTWTKKTVTTSEDFSWTLIGWASTCEDGGGDDGDGGAARRRRSWVGFTA